MDAKNVKFDLEADEAGACVLYLNELSEFDGDRSKWENAYYTDKIASLQQTASRDGNAPQSARIRSSKTTSAVNLSLSLSFSFSVIASCLYNNFSSSSIPLDFLSQRKHIIASIEKESMKQKSARKSDVLVDEIEEKTKTTKGGKRKSSKIPVHSILFSV